MRSLRFTGTTALIVCVLASYAWGVSKCVIGCRAQMSMCGQTALIAQLACRADCSDNADPRACRRGCMQTFSATKRDTCVPDAKSCKASCAPGADLDMTCLGSCGTDLQSCLQPVRQAAIACVLGCKSAPDRLTCLQGCLAAAQADGTTCGDDFTTCVGACASPAP